MWYMPYRSRHGYYTSHHTYRKLILFPSFSNFTRSCLSLLHTHAHTHKHIRTQASTDILNNNNNNVHLQCLVKFCAETETATLIVSHRQYDSMLSVSFRFRFQFLPNMPHTFVHALLLAILSLSSCVCECVFVSICMKQQQTPFNTQYYYRRRRCC